MESARIIKVSILIVPIILWAWLVLHYTMLDNNWSVGACFIGGSVKNYHAVSIPLEYKKQYHYAIRAFNLAGENKYLVVNPDTFHTQIIKQSDATLIKKPRITKYDVIKTRILRWRGWYNVGVETAQKKYKENEVFMTIDMCPSIKRGMETSFFKKFIEYGKKEIGIAITGDWIKRHKKEFAWLQEKRRNGELNIVWINHTMHHRYYYNVPIYRNLMLLPGTNIEDEMLSVEKMLIENGEVPSVFFRFPGLVSSQKLREEIINKYGLIPLGSNAWLAKWQKPKSGSIILIHGNKNERTGVRKALNLLKSDADFIYKDIHDAF